jgi:hypothetical protein
LLKRALCLAALILAACPGSDTSDRDGRPEPATFVPIYFYEDGALIPEYRPLSGDEVVEDIVTLLLEGPQGSGRTSSLPADADVLSEFEVHERLILGMSDAFWAGPIDEIRKRAAQLVFSLASLEEGKEITLLKGPTPGEVTGRDGRVLAQPLGREDFGDLRPWIQVVQPVAGALVANPIPIRLIVRGPGRPSIEVVADGEVVGQGSGDAVSWSSEAADGEVRITARGHTVVVPVRLRP